MKKIYYFCIAALAILAVGCTEERDIDLDTHDGKGLEFVHFASSSDAWLVSEDDESYTYQIPIACTYAHEQDVTYNVTLGKGTTGKEGVDFSIPNKSVTIKAGQYLANLPVTVLYATTGLGFELELVLGVDDALINPVYGNSMAISVKSDKVIIDWEWLEGTWNCQDYSYYSKALDGDPYPVAIAKVSETEGTITGIWGGGALNFTVDFAAKTLSIPGIQFLFHTDTYSADVYFLAVDAAAGFEPYEDIYTPVVATLSAQGIVIDNYDCLLVGGPYNGYTWAGGEKSTLTR
ncbi:MAG: hypothetical protein IK031_04160 [Bacteroidales bacterium]|nr:hypothetical protein [Bacteroidales bacterium]